MHIRLSALLGAVFFVFFSNFPTHGQSFRLFHYSELDGLPNGLIKGISEDENGVVWLATDEGLVRYDGFSFTSFRDALPTPFTKDVRLTEKWGLVASSDEGLFQVSLEEGKPEFRRLFPDQGLRLIKDLYEDREGQLWFANNGTVFCEQQQRVDSFSFERKYHSGDFVKSFSIVEDGLGRLFVISRNGALFLYDREAKQFGAPIHQLEGEVNDAIQVYPGKVWVALNTGIYELSTSRGQQLQSVHRISELDTYVLGRLNDRQLMALVRNKGAYILSASGKSAYPLDPGQSEKSFTCYYKSRSGDVWVGTDNGLNLLKAQEFFAPFTEKLGGHYIQSVLCKNGTVLISDGGQVFRAEKQGERWEANSFCRPGFDTYYITEAPTGYWLGGADARLALVDFNGRVQQRYDLSDYGGAVYNMAQDDNGNLWLCQSDRPGLTCLQADGEIRHFGTESGLSPEAVEAVYFDPVRQYLYAGGVGEDESLFRYNPSIEIFENISPVFGLDRSLTFRVLDLAGDENGRLILGTTLGLFEYKSGQVSPLGGEDTKGVAVLAVETAPDGRVWFASAEGANMLHEGTVYSFTDINGLPAKTIGYRSITRDDDGNIWIGTSQGVALAPISLRARESRQPMTVGLESSTEGLLPGQEQYEIKTNDFLALDVLSVGFPAALTKYHLRYIYEDSTVEVSTAEPSVFFSNMPAGLVNLEISARQSLAHQWSRPLSLGIKTTPLWYETWYGALSILLAGGLLVYGLSVYRSLQFQRRSRRLSAYNQELERRVQEGIQDYQMLVNNIGDTVMKISPEGTLLYTSPSWERNYGYTREETEGHNFTLFVHPDDIPDTTHALQRLITGENTADSIEHRIKHRDGEWRWVETIGDVDPGTKEVVIISRDITDRKEAEEQMKRQSEMQEILMNISAKYINLPLDEVEQAINVSLKEMGEFVDVDRAYIFDYDFDSGVTNNTYEWCSEGVEPQIENLQGVPVDMIPDWVKAHQAGQPMYVPDVFALEKESGLRQILEPQDIKSLLTVPLMHGNECVGFVGFDSVTSYHTYSQKEITLLYLFAQLLVNIRSRSQRQKELQQLLNTTTDQNRRLRDFSFMTSHNIRSSVANMLGLTTMIEAEPGNQEYIAMLQQTTETLDATISNVNSLLNFEREVNTQELEDCPVSQTLERVSNLINQTIREREIQLMLSIPDDLTIKAIPAYLDSIFQNLLTNAIKYGTTEKSKVIEVMGGKSDGEVFIAVKDYGLGIDMDKYGDRLFKLGTRLHSTSSDGQGLGLFMTKYQVEGMGGRITVNSEVDNGTTFRVYFPAG